MFDSEGRQIWERELDSFGRLKSGDHNSCPFMYQGQYYDKEIELAYNRFRYYDSEDGRYISKDPIGLASQEFGFYNYVYNPNGWVDILGLAGYKKKKKKSKTKDIYRFLNETDAKRLKEGKSIVSKGKGGTIKEHVQGKRDTKYISASEGDPDYTYDSGYGLIKINDVDDLKMVAHKNVLQGVKGDALATKDATRAKEVLFIDEIPFENIEIINLP